MVVRGDLAVHLREDVLVRVADVGGREAARIEAILGLENLLHAGRGRVADADADRIFAPRRIRPDHGTGERRHPVLNVDRSEELQPVSENGPTDRAAVLGLRKVRLQRNPGRDGTPLWHRVPHEPLVLEEAEERAVEGVGAGLGDGVDQAAREAALPHVERRDQHLILLDRLHRDRVRVRLAARRAARGEPEQVVVHSPVDLNVVEPVVLSPKGGARHAGGDHLGNRAHEIGKVAAQGRETTDHVAGDSSRGPGARRRQQRVLIGRHRDSRHFDRRALEREVAHEALAQGERDPGPLLGREPQRPHLQRVGAADLRVLEIKTSVRARARGVALAVGGVDEGDERLIDGSLALVGHATADRRRRDTLRRGGSRGEEGGEERRDPDPQRIPLHRSFSGSKTEGKTRAR